MRYSRVRLMLLCLIPLISMAAPGREDGRDSGGQHQPKYLIIKLQADQNISLTSNREGIALTGLSGIDQVNRRYAVTNQRFLLPHASSKQRPQALQNILVVKIPDGVDMYELMDSYSHLGVVEYVEPDWPIELYDYPNDPLYSHQWYLNNTGQGYYHVLRREGDNNDTLVIEYGIPDADIDAQEVFDNLPSNTTTAIIALIDCGVDLDNPELAGRLWVNADEIDNNGIDDDHNGYIDDYRGCNFYSAHGDDPIDYAGHGTHCAGILAAVANNSEGIVGIGGDCQIMPIKFAASIVGLYILVEAIVYATENGADVISMSLGTDWNSALLCDAIEYARIRGTTPVAAVGNTAMEQYNYPAACPLTIAVGATTSSDLVTEFSTFGSHLDVVAPGLSMISLRADSTDYYGLVGEPNVHIIEENYYMMSGTSMSCPVVAAIAAYMRAVSPGLDPDLIQDILQQTAMDIVDPYGLGEYYPGWDQYSGYGRVNMYDAISAVPNLRAKITSPVPHQFASGPLDITGIANGDDFIGYTLEYGFGTMPSEWTEIASSTAPVNNGILAIWDTGDLNGQITIRLTVGETNFSLVTFFLSDGDLADINSPEEADTVGAFTPVTGTAVAVEFTYYRLEYRDSLGIWREIIESTIPVINDELGIWQSGNLSDGNYTLRLSVYSSGGLAASDTLSVYYRSYFSSEQAWRISFSPDITCFPNYGDFDNDGINEIVLGTREGILFYNPDGTLKTAGIPSIPVFDYRIPVVIGNLDNDGTDDFVAVGWEYATPENRAWLVGCPSSATPFVIQLEIVPNMYYLGYNTFGPYVMLKDIDGDGIDEIHYFPQRKYANLSHYRVFNADGSFRLQIPGFEGFYSYLPADLNGDGVDEIYLASNYLYQLDLNCTFLDSVDLRIAGTTVFRPGRMFALDIDCDNKLELVVEGSFDDYSINAHTYVFEEGLQPVPGWPRKSIFGVYAYSTGFFFGDINNDCFPESFMTMVDNNSYLLAWNPDGTPYSGDSTMPVLAMLPDLTWMSIMAIGDMDGDGYADPVMYMTGENLFHPEYSYERLFAVDRFGITLPGWPIVTVPWDECCPANDDHMPMIGDINQDGNVDLLMTTSSNDLVFINFPGSAFSGNAPLPCWKYNRRMNNIATLSSGACGDPNGDTETNISDAVYVINYVFVGGPSPDPYSTGDCNCDTVVNVSDAVMIINYVFMGGNAPCDTDGDGIPDC
jgi:subtilisin family serine protease